jgi:uncharacterized protein (TIGR03067 family)
MSWLPMLGLALTVAAPGVKDPPKKAGAPSIVGEWACDSGVRGGMEFPAGVATDMVLEFGADGKFRVRVGAAGAGGTKEGTYTTKPAKEVTEIDMITGVGDTAPGIFKIEKDKLTLCFDDRGAAAERPTAFESPAGSRVMLMTFKRVEKKKE